MREGWGVWKSTDGGWSWRTASAGLTDLSVSDLAISPAFAQDQTLFAAAYRGGLFRSTDGGERWVPLSDRYRPKEAHDQSPGVVVLSPDYGRDRTLFVSHYGLQRSTDGGETWTRVSQAMDSLALSPDYAADHTLYGWAGSSGLMRSTDGGETWTPVSAGLILDGFGSGRVMIPPDYATSQTVYFVWTPSSPDIAPQFWRSTDAAATWQSLAGDPPQAATPVQLSSDGAAFIALDQAGRLVRWPVQDLPWQSSGPPDMSAMCHLSARPVAGLCPGSDPLCRRRDVGDPAVRRRRPDVGRCRLSGPRDLWLTGRAGRHLAR